MLPIPNGNSRGRLSGWSNLLLAGGSLVVSLALAEVVVRWLRVDDLLLTDTMMLLRLEPEVHQKSADWFLHYELKPDSKGSFTEPGGPSYRVHVDPFGARYPTHPAEKAPGTFRVLCVGGSTTYGAAVNDEDTLPAAMERRLSADAPPGVRFEAWNFGLHAYVLSQAAHRARLELARRNPDLILVQLHNVGPRCIALEPDGDRRDALRRHAEDPHLMFENFPPPRWVSETLHFAVLRASALYRSLTGLRLRSARQHDDAELFHYAEDLSRKEASALLGEAERRGVPVVFYVLPVDGGAVFEHSAQGLPPDRVIDLYLPDQDPEYYRVHPSPYGLDQFAARLIVLLREKGLLPVAVLDP